MSVNRFQPAGSVNQYKTYQIRQPKTGHTRIALCQAAGCENYERGWVTKIPSLGPQADYIRNHSGRRFRETVQDGISTFTFYPGQQCFQEHHVVDRPQFFLVRDGDWRGNPTGRQMKFSGARPWVDAFGEHQAKLAERIERG